jgi:hypothetical protein
MFADMLKLVMSFHVESLQKTARLAYIIAVGHLAILI